MSYVHAVLSAVPLLKREWNKKQRLLLQNAVRNTLPKHRAAACLRHRLGSSAVTVSASTSGATRLGGLMVCNAFHICPICHHNKMEQEKAMLADFVTKHYADGGFMVDAVLTIPHAAGESLSDVQSRLELVWNSLRSKAIWRELSEYLGIVGSVRKLEVTLTSNGWHPHYHVSLLCNWAHSRGLRGFNRQTVLADAHAQVAASWARAGERSGIKVSLFAQAAVAIVAGVDAQKAIAYNAKNMGYGGKSKSLTPMDLLRVVDQSTDPTAVCAARRLFSEYAAAVKGKHALSYLGTARVAKSKLSGKDKPPAASEPEYVRLGTISGDAWNAVVKAGQREAMAQVMTCEELMQAVLRAAHFAGFTFIPSGWLTFMPESKTVIMVKCEPTSIPSLVLRV
ncbi:MAG: hypothetical protein PHX60_14935 [Giesbergeria sp.]|uniref:hypothetical protein n=1 Tax=Giesbergeria sp. TaxID=2818473 RepID=UPI0026311B8C|nr:hypothetical protein [Giesbergeria sp.]MDD2610949.1 hypothetical protein [Giesbergeria sp.]